MQMKTKLSKKVCKRCYEENECTWYGFNERNWKKGYIVCVDIWDIVYLKKGLPDECPYKLEHIVLGNQDETM